MKVKRIVTDIATADVSRARVFYADILGLKMTPGDPFEGRQQRFESIPH
jgi:hypothetical protein